MTMAFEKGSTERAMFADLYRLFEKDWDASPDTDMEELIQDATAFQEKYTTDRDSTAAEFAAILIERTYEARAGLYPLCDVGSRMKEMIAALLERRK